jgi:CubicO group peptidase (beta-lactamase class C family)
MRHIVSVFLALLCGTISSLAQSTSPALTTEQIRNRIDQQAPALLAQYNVPSVAIAYIRDGRIAFTAVYGEQSPGVPATPATLYNIASLTKPITAETILRLASLNALSLDESMAPYWVDPDIKDNPWAKLLTPKLCLSHQTGFANWRRMTGGTLTFKFQPGTATGYSGEGYNYVAHFTEKKTGQSLEALAQSNVFDPIGMHDTAYTVRPWFAGRLASARTDKGNIDPETTTHWIAADLVRTTISDYAKFVVSVMQNEGITPAIAAQRLTFDHDLVGPNDKKQLCALMNPSSADCNISAGMGLGWQVIHINGETIVDHTGGDTGVHTLAFYLPNRNLGAVLFTNGDAGMKVIRDLVRTIYPNEVFIATIN